MRDSPDRSPAPALTLRYGPDPNNVGELRVPPGSGPHPIAIIIHGGYWRARYDFAYLDPLCAALTSAGIATWNVEYRRVGNVGGGWPGTFTDVGGAADFLRSIQATYDLALDRVLALGHSAGGHLALWLAARHRSPSGTPLSADDPLPLRGVVGLAAVADLRLAYDWMLSDCAVAELLGGSPEEHPERYDLPSPTSHLPLGVPQILLHGLDDEDVPYAMSERYYAAALAAGDPVQLISLPGIGHFELIEPASEVWTRLLQAVSELVK